MQFQPSGLFSRVSYPSEEIDKFGSTFERAISAALKATQLQVRSVNKAVVDLKLAGRIRGVANDYNLLLQDLQSTYPVIQSHAIVLALMSYARNFEMLSVAATGTTPCPPRSKELPIPYQTLYTRLWLFELRMCAIMRFEPAQDFCEVLHAMADLRSNTKCLQLHCETFAANGYLQEMSGRILHDCVLFLDLVYPDVQTITVISLSLMSFRSALCTLCDLTLGVPNVFFFEDYFDNLVRNSDA